MFISLFSIKTQILHLAFRTIRRYDPSEWCVGAEQRPYEMIQWNWGPEI